MVGPDVGGVAGDRAGGERALQRISSVRLPRATLTRKAVDFMAAIWRSAKKCSVSAVIGVARTT
ncbi:MAG: hypothetical protein U5K43_13575 [Halofilum sp. (in: g-proteobacteria)]|nr:hypothetical protein [Halofilum sp. (in: g-proteobacteria)]